MLISNYLNRTLKRYRYFVVIIWVIIVIKIIWHHRLMQKFENDLFKKESHFLLELDSTILQQYHKKWPNAKDILLKESLFLQEPDSTIPRQYHKKSPNTKVILLYYGKYKWLRGNGEFQNCPVSDCFMSWDHSNLKSAEAVLFWSKNIRSPLTKPRGQIWVTYFHESPFSTKLEPAQIDLTISYMRNSTFFEPYLKNISSEKLPTPYVPSVLGRTKKVAWFVNNCRTVNRRFEHAKKLSQYIKVDIYGECTKNICPKDWDNPKGPYHCVIKTLKNYLFYLAFENANCRDYITTETLYHPLKSDVIPIVMGAHPDDYKDLLPPHSYIHVDDFKSPKHLAKYLNYLINNRTAYLEYFHWKSMGYKSSLSSRNVWCDLCSRLHGNVLNLTESQKKATNVQIDKWWLPSRFCVSDRWKH